MKKNIIITLGTFLMLCIGVNASVERTINVVFDKVKLNINGKTLKNETILYNGTTYVPIRVVSEALGQKVSYDSENNIAYISSDNLSSTTNNTNNTQNQNNNKNNTQSQNSNNKNAKSTIDIPRDISISDSYNSIRAKVTDYSIKEIYLGGYYLTLKIEGEQLSRDGIYRKIYVHFYDKDGYEIGYDYFLQTDQPNFKISGTVSMPKETVKIEYKFS